MFIQAVCPLPESQLLRLLRRLLRETGKRSYQRALPERTCESPEGPQKDPIGNSWTEPPCDVPLNSPCAI